MATKNLKLTSDDQMNAEAGHGEQLVRPVIVICSGKGGVGKTLNSQAARIALLDAGHQVLCVDADGSNSSLKRQVADAHLLDGSDGAELLASLERVFIEQCLGAGKSLVVDTGGGFDKVMRNWFASEEVTKILSAHSIKVISLTVIDSSLDSAGHVMENMDAMRGAHHVVVMNLGHVPGSVGERAFKPLFDNAEFKSYAVKSTLIVMPRLQDAIEIDALGARLHSISEPTSPAAGNPFLVARTKTWLASITSSLQAAFSSFEEIAA